MAELLAELAKGWGHGLGDAVGYAVVGGILAEKTVNCFFMIFTPPRSPGKKNDFHNISIISTVDRYVLHGIWIACCNTASNTIAQSVQTWLSDLSAHERPDIRPSCLAQFVL